MELVLSMLYGCLFALVSRIFWLLDWSRSRFVEDSEKVRKLRVLARNRVTHGDVDLARLDEFIIWKEALVEKEYVLKPEVSLFKFTSTHAVFVEFSEEDSRDLYDVKKHPFLFMIEYDLGRSFIMMSLETFHQLADMIGDPVYPFVFLPNTGRCGSTLVSNVFNLLPNSLSLSEPNCLADMVNMHYTSHQITSEELQGLVKSSTRYLLRNRQYKIALIKARARCTILMNAYHKSFPNNQAPIIYMYRNAVDVSLSYLKMYQNLQYRSAYMKYATSKMIESPDTSYFRVYPPGSEDFDELKRMKDTRYGLEVPMKLRFVLRWGISNFLYTDFHHEHPDHARSLCYDDLVAEPEGVLKELLAVCGQPVEYLPLAMEAMKDDSQKGLAISTRNNNKVKMNYSEDELAAMTELLERIPLISASFSPDLPGKITGI